MFKVTQQVDGKEELPVEKSGEAFSGYWALEGCQLQARGQQLIRALSSVIDSQALNFYKNELTRPLGRGKVPLPPGAASWVQKAHSSY